MKACIYYNSQEFLGSTQFQEVAMLTNLVPGHYTFYLSVTDRQGGTDKDTVLVHVLKAAHENQLVELEIDADPLTYTESQKVRDTILLFTENYINYNSIHY